MQFRLLRLSVGLILTGCGVTCAASNEVAHGGATLPSLPPVTSHIHVDQSVTCLTS